MSESLKSKLDKNLSKIKELYPNFLGITDKRQIDVDKFNGKHNLSVGLDSLSPPTTLKVLVDCSDSILKTLKLVSKYSEITDNDESEIDETTVKKIKEQNTRFKAQLKNSELIHRRQTESILNERDNLKSERDQLLNEQKTLIERIDKMKETHQKTWNDFLKFERTIEIMKNNCKYKLDCINKPKTDSGIIDARHIKLE